MRAECQSACAAYALALPSRSFSGRLGERHGRGPGSSVEFVDFRDYAPGDDVRHVDWRTYARTDQLKVRLYREEIAPVLDVVLDTSASMGVTAAKAQAAVDLVHAACEWASRGGGAARLWAAGGGAIDPAAFERDGVALLAGPPCELWPHAPLRRCGLRLLVSDFLTPEDPGPAVRRVAAGGSHLYVLQLLDPWELEPISEGPRTLVDCESKSRLDLVLDRPTVDRYRARLTALRSAVATAVRGAGGTYACVRADSPAVMFRADLLRQGVIQPR